DRIRPGLRGRQRRGGAGFVVRRRRRRIRQALAARAQLRARRGWPRHRGDRASCTGEEGWRVIGPPAAASRAWRVLVVLLWLAGTLRAFALWSHEPLHAYA